jgi:flagellar basal-body rod modification protein FlgD
MQVNQSIGGTVATGGGADMKDPADFGKDEFMKLLIAQLQNQDPTAPQESNEFMAQLAQFTNVEKLDTANRLLGEMLVSQSANYQATLTTLVGKDVVFNNNEIELGPQGPGEPFYVDLQGHAVSVNVLVKDEFGNTVRTLYLGEQEAGLVKAEWDGRDVYGVPLPEGKYTFEVSAADTSGNPVEAFPRRKGHIAGLTFAQGYPQLMVNGLPISMGDVVEVQESM